MNVAPYRITLGRDGKRPRRLMRLIEGENLCGATLCAQQWLVWSNAADRGKREKFAWYRVEFRVGTAVWADAASGTLADARLAWTEADEARIDAEPLIGPTVGRHDSSAKSKARAGRIPRAGKSRLAQLVTKVLNEQR